MFWREVRVNPSPTSIVDRRVKLPYTRMARIARVMCIIHAWGCEEGSKGNRTGLVASSGMDAMGAGNVGEL